jgi:hypothetical protein
MVNALLAGNIEKALSYHSEFVRDEYRQRYKSMGPQGIKDVFKNMKRLELDSLYEDGIARCGAIRKEKSGEFSYPVTFGLNKSNGKWEIISF